VSTAAGIWKKRVEGWRASGESCKAYAARIGVNPNTDEVGVAARGRADAVGWFDVAVDDPSGVGGLKGGGDLVSHLQGALPRDRALALEEVR
jgi:hypothetical protein